MSDAHLNEAFQGWQQPQTPSGVGAASANAVAAAQGAPVNPDDPHSVRLTRPIDTHQGRISVLTIRPPKAADFMEIGTMPFRQRISEGGTQVDIDFKLAGVWLSRLTGHDQSILGTLESRDFIQAVANLMTIIGDVGDDAGK